MTEWHKTACILCESNCGIEVRLGGDSGRTFERIRGDKAHPASKGYTCEKALRLDHYQNSRDRLTSPMRRGADGTYEAIDWDTAIGEIAARLTDLKQAHGGESIFYFGGGGQGNHLPGIYASATRKALGIRYRSNALAQEKTGEIWVNSKMIGNYVRGDFENTQVAMFIGKNPWQSHSIPEARRTLRAISSDPERSLVVIDPRVTKTAELADIHLRVKPGRDAYLIAAMVGMLVQGEMTDESFIAGHVSGWDEFATRFMHVDVARLCSISGVPEEQVRTTVELIAGAASVAVFEDLGVQMNRHSTLVSYLEKALWVGTGNFAKPGAQNIPSSLIPLAASGPAKKDYRTPVSGERIFGGLVPAAVIPEEILTDHPDRYRAMIIESANPAHSMPDSQAWREALRQLDLVVVIDIAMTETAREADYVLPTPTQYEKYEAVTFTFEFPENFFYLRPPVLEPPPGVMTEPEIHARLLEAMGLVDPDAISELNEALDRGLEEFGMEFLARVSANPALAGISPVALYRTLGSRLPEGAAAAAVLWGAAHQLAMKDPESVARAGHRSGQELFEAILRGPVKFTSDAYDDTWGRVRTEDGRLHMENRDLESELDELLAGDGPEEDPRFPLLLSAGERRSFTANTIFRDPGWRKKDTQGALRISEGDATRLGLTTGSEAMLTTARGQTSVVVEVSDTMMEGHISLPNGLGVDYPEPDGERVTTGASTNELTSAQDRDALAGTPWHKSVPARLEPSG